VTAAVGQTPSSELLEIQTAGEPSWLSKRRRAAWAAYAELPMPSSARDEDWRRTDLGKLDFDALPIAETVVQVDVPAEGAGEGVVACSLAEAAKSYSDALRGALSKVAPGASKLVALNSALWDKGIFVFAPARARLIHPLRITWSADGGGLSLPLTVVVLEQQSQLIVTETYASSAPTVTNALTVVDGVADSVLDYAVIQNQHLESTHFSMHDIHVGKDAQARFFGLSVGAKLQKSYWNCYLEGQGAQAYLNGALAARGVQHLDHQSLQVHAAPDTTSRLALKAAVWDSAQSVYSGLIEVEKEAVHADGYVQNRNLILGQDARAHSIPRLEIKASDVKCGHGATAGHIDDEQRFYLESRGVTRLEAEQMIVRGFFDDALAAVSSEAIREEMSALLEGKISANG